MDTNFYLDVAEGYPTTVLVSLARGDLASLDQLHASTRCTACASGFGWGEGPTTRIDGVLADAGVAGRLTQVGAAVRAGAAGPRGGAVRPDAATGGAAGAEDRRLDPFEVRAWDPGVLEAIVARLLGPHAEERRLLLQQRSVNMLWERWTWMAEETSLAFSDQALQDATGVVRPLSLPYAPPAVKRGRAMEAMIRGVSSGPAKAAKRGGLRTSPLMRVTGVLRHICGTLFFPDFRRFPGVIISANLSLAGYATPPRNYPNPR